MRNEERGTREEGRGKGRIGEKGEKSGKKK